MARSDVQTAIADDEEVVIVVSISGFRSGLTDEHCTRLFKKVYSIRERLRRTGLVVPHMYRNST